MRRLPLAVAAMTVALIMGVPSAWAGAGVADGAIKDTKDRYALGDSVMLGAKKDLKSLGFRIVDAKESRQAYKGPSLLRSRGSSLPTNVVVHLGTNGTFPLDVCKKIVKTAGPSRRVFFVTIHVPRSWKKGNNKVIRKCDAAFAGDRVHVIDWDALASKHPKWLYKDHTHLRPQGAAGFAELINSSVMQAVAAAKRHQVEGAFGSASAGMSRG